MLKLEDFKKFKLEPIAKIVGGRDGTITGSSMGSNTFIDVEWNDGGDPSCGVKTGIDDTGATDDPFIGLGYSG